MAKRTALRRAALGAGLAATSLLVLAGPAAAEASDPPEPVLGGLTAGIELSEDGDATVELHYLVTGDAEVATGVEVLSFSFLDFAEAELSRLRVSDGGQELESAAEEEGRKTAVTVVLAEPIGPEESRELVVAYEVPGAGERDGDLLVAEIPILTLDQPAADAAAGTFTADLQLPEGYELYQGFPTDITTEEGLVTYTAPAAPAVVQASASSGQPPLLTLERVVDAVLVLLILGGALAFYLSFVRPRRAAAARDSGHDAPELAAQRHGRSQ